MLGQHVGWANRASDELAATVRADTVQPMLDAIGAERALIGADPSLLTVGRKIAVAAFAVGAQFQHCYSAATATLAGPATKKPWYAFAAISSHFWRYAPTPPI